MVDLDKISSIANYIFNQINQDKTRFRIKSIEKIMFQSPNQITPIEIIRIEVETDNMASFIGLAQLPSAEWRKGFLSYYYQGFIEGQLNAIYINEFQDLPEIFIDVKSKNEDVGTTFKILSYNDAVKYGYLHPESALSLKMKEYGLDAIFIISEQISGPSVAMINAIESASSYIEEKNILDLFGGTGSLSVVAIANGANKSVSVDSCPILYRINHKQYGRKIVYIQKDAFSYIPTKQFDIAVLDPFFDQSLDVSQRIIPSLYIHKIKSIIFHICNSYEKSWIESVKNDVKKTYINSIVEEYNGSAILFGGDIVEERL